MTAAPTSSAMRPALDADSVVTLPSAAERSLRLARAAEAANQPASTGRDELLELLQGFNAATARLLTTHETLQSEVRRLERELREAHEQLGRARELAALGEMAAGIAHEVRNPLGSIRLYATMLKDDLADRPEQREIAQRIGAAVSRLDGVVGDVLHFARRLAVQPEWINAGELIASAIETCREPAVRTGVTVCMPPKRTGAPVLVWCDANLLHQALVNVLRNAIEACGAGTVPGESPEVKIEILRRQVLDAHGARQSMVAIRVRDNGPGVDPDVAPRLFTPFVTTKGDGTGLGLAIVHRIVDAHGGRVSIRSAEGGARGAIVEILLPADRGPASLTKGVAV